MTSEEIMFLLQILTFSPLIIVQWRVTLIERKLILEMHPFSTEP